MTNARKAEIRRASIILNRKPEWIRRWLRAGDLAGLSLDDIAQAIGRNIAGHSAAGKRAARDRLAEAASKDQER